VSLSHFPPAPEAPGFSGDELKLLLVAVRNMRRTFAQAQKAEPDPALAAYAALYDSLFEKLRDLAGPLPETVEGALLE
jgi:hypothetical protein